GYGSCTLSAAAEVSCNRTPTNPYDGFASEMVGIGSSCEKVPTPSAPSLSNGANGTLGRRGHDTEPGLGRYAIEKQRSRGRSPCRTGRCPGFRAPLRHALGPDLQSG